MDSLWIYTIRFERIHSIHSTVISPHYQLIMKFYIYWLRNEVIWRLIYDWNDR